MTTLTNATPQTLPGTASPTPQIASFTFAVQAQPGPNGGSFRPVFQAIGTDGSIVTPPQGWKLTTDELKAFSDACVACLTAATATASTPLQTLIPALKARFAYSPVA